MAHPAHQRRLGAMPARVPTVAAAPRGCPARCPAAHRSGLPLPATHHGWPAEGGTRTLRP
eukprot:379003-Prorocentrum_lima.AAC.1